MEMGDLPRRVSLGRGWGVSLGFLDRMGDCRSERWNFFRPYRLNSLH
jgi:hypothetical protein